MPFVFYNLGFVLAFISVLGMSIAALLSFQLLLKTKDLTPMRLDSLYQISYILFGRISIFMVSIIVFLRNFGGIVLCYMIIGENLSSLAL